MIVTENGEAIEIFVDHRIYLHFKLIDQHFE